RVVVLAGMGDLLGTWYGHWLTFMVRHVARMVPAYELALQGPSGPRTIVGLRQALAEGERERLRPVAIDGGSVAFLQYTGGTTGRSKGAILTHRNVVAAVLQAEAWFAPATDRVGDVRRINAIAALPLYH